MKRLLITCSVVLFFLFLGVLIIRNTKGNSNQEFTIGIENGTIYEELGEDLPKVKLLRGFHDIHSEFHALASRQVDAVITDRLVGLREIQKKDYNDILPTGQFHFREEKAVAVRKSADSLRQMLNRGLAELIKSGKFATISKFYFGCNIGSDIADAGKLERESHRESVGNDGSWEAVKRKDWILLAFDTNNPPFSYYNAHHVFTGFDVEIARELCHQLGIKHFLPIPMGGEQMMAGLRAGIYDGVWGGIPLNAITEVGFSFTNPYCISGAQLFVRKDSKITGFATLGRKMPSEPPMGGGFINKEYSDEFNKTKFEKIP